MQELKIASLFANNNGILFNTLIKQLTAKPTNINTIRTIVLFLLAAFVIIFSLFDSYMYLLWVHWGYYFGGMTHFVGLKNKYAVHLVLNGVQDLCWRALIGRVFWSILKLLYSDKSTVLKLLILTQLYPFLVLLLSLPHFGNIIFFILKKRRKYKHR